MSKIYMPSELINNSYNYEYNSNYIIVHKNTNCYTQYQTTYCDCQRVYYDFGYSISNNYTCANNYTVDLNKNDLTSDFYYRNDIDSILLIFLILFIFIIIFPFKLVSRLFGRWFKL